MGLRGVAVTGAFVLGGLAVVGGVGHWVAVTIKALGEGRGYDVRLGDMLAIGFLPFLLGAAMVAGAWQASRGTGGLALAAAASGFVAIVLVVLWRVIFTGPEGSPVGGAITVAVYATEAVAAWMVW